jgi:hypothetical protein
VPDFSDFFLKRYAAASLFNQTQLAANEDRAKSPLVGNNPDRRAIWKPWFAVMFALVQPCRHADFAFDL